MPPSQIAWRGPKLLVSLYLYMFLSYFDLPNLKEKLIYSYFTCIFPCLDSTTVYNTSLFCVPASQSGLDGMAHFEQGQAYHIPATLHIIPTQFT